MAGQAASGPDGGPNQVEPVEHPQLDPPRIFDAITFLLQFGPLRRSPPGQQTLQEDVRAAVQDYLDKNGLGERVRLLAGGREGDRATPVSIFGAEFRPHLALEEAGKRVAAILVSEVRGGAAGLAQAAGLALLCSFQYPWVLCLVLDQGRRLRENRELDHDFRAYMWHHRRIRFLFR